MPSPLRIILTPVGSSGDVHPFIGIGLALQQRGHDVRLVATGKFKNIVERAGLTFVEYVSAEEYERVTQNADLWHPRKGFATVMSSVTERMRGGLKVLESLHVPGRTVLVGHSISISARIFEELHRVPAVTVHLAPAILRSDYDTPVPALGMQWLSRSPRSLKRAFWWLADQVVINPHLKGPLNRWRRELGLPAVKRPLHDWIHSPQRIIGLWPEWFGPVQPDWPTVRLAGFPLWDEAGHHELAPEVDRFIASADTSGRDKPIVITPGSAMRHGHDFFEVALAAVAKLKRRALLLTQYPEQLPANLPPNVMHVRYAPFSELLPRCAAIVHHGGIGTCAQSLAAGIPQLIMPMSHDQPDNAHRLETLGVGKSLTPRRFTATRVADVLDQLLLSHAVAAACMGYAAKIHRGEGVQRAADFIEQIAEAPNAA